MLMSPFLVINLITHHLNINVFGYLNSIIISIYWIWNQYSPLHSLYLSPTHQPDPLTPSIQKWSRICTIQSTISKDSGDSTQVILKPSTKTTSPQESSASLMKPSPRWSRWYLNWRRWTSRKTVSSWSLKLWPYSTLSLPATSSHQSLTSPSSAGTMIRTASQTT